NTSVSRSPRQRVCESVTVTTTPPSNTSLWVSPSQDFVEGRSLSFTCHSDGAPPPSLALSREGVELSRVDSAPSLTFSLGPASLQDSALYQCEATNQLGQQLVSTYVSVRAHPLQVETSPLLSADRGSALVLSCRASGCLRPTITWSRSDQNQNRSVLQGAGNQDGLSLLRLQDLDLQDQGEYQCEAECDGVSRTRTIQVRLYGQNHSFDVFDVFDVV
uniref:Ig-like domain-containing protein n=1 Tax=Gouania willdenowi TaxID=441366 RepID=A0A8C5DDJ0_GOUWI